MNEPLVFQKMLGGKPIEFKDVMSDFDKFDIIFVATTCDTFLITFKKIEKNYEKEKERDVDIGFIRSQNS